MMRRVLRSFGYVFNRTRWNAQPTTSIEGLSCAQETITVRLPKGTYSGIGMYSLNKLKNTEIDATFYIKDTVEGTPLQAVSALSSESFEPGALHCYIEGSNKWLFSRELFILNGSVVFIILPTSPKKVLIGVDLMRCSSKISKVLKERVIPDIVLSISKDGGTVVITDTWDLVVRVAKTPERLITKDSIKDVLLKHIDEIV